MKKVLIITYYWPPSGGAGVQRWLKFVKYLRDFGWEPVIYTASNSEFPEQDLSLQNDIPPHVEIIKTPIWEPYSFYKKFIGQKKEEKINAAFLSETKKRKFSENLSIWIRGNFFIPDARKFWIKPSIKYLKKYLKLHSVDAIVSTGPPHSLHMIALEISKSLSLPWLADFRDPWTNIDFYHELKLSFFADKKHHRMELSVLKNASAVTVISKSMADEFRELHPRNYDIITNGYDTDDFMLNSEFKPDKKFSISHIGTMTKSRNPEVLWTVLNELIIEENGFSDDLEIKLVGKLDFSVWESIDHHNLRQHIVKIDYLPHNEVSLIQQQSQLLLLLINNTPNAKGILTGKFFEYLAAKRPILCIGPIDGDAAQILKETNAGLISGFDDSNELKKNILLFYNKYKSHQLSIVSNKIEQYSRKALSNKMAEILNNIIKK